MEEVESAVACADQSDDASLPSLEAQLRELQFREKELMKQKELAEQEFRANRAKFRQLFIQKEDELKRESEELVRSKEREAKLVAELEALKREIGDAKSEVTVAQCTKEYEIEMERRKCSEEIATLQRLMDERLEDARRATAARYENEIRHLREKLDCYRASSNAAASSSSSDNRELSLPSVGPSVLSVVSKTLAKTVDRIQSFQNDDVRVDERRSTTHSEDDVELLRSLVSTLEKEVGALKDKLRVADEQLRVFESNQNDLITGCEALAKLVSGESPETVMAELDVKMKEATVGREITISDLELHIAVLNAQKATLREDLDRLRTQANELRQSLERERRAHQELKDFSAKANDQYLKTERDRMHEIKRIHEILTTEQIKKFEASRDCDGQPDNSNESAGNPTGEDCAGERPPSTLSTPSKTSLTQEKSDCDLTKPASDERQIQVSEKEWNLLHQEVESAREKFVKTCPMCANYEIRLQDAQKDQRSAERQAKSLEQAVERYKEDLNRESRYRKEMEEKWLGLAKEYERQVTELYRNLELREKEFGQIRSDQQRWVKEVGVRQKELIAGREAAQRELIKLRAENDDLVGKHSVHSQELQNETINLPDTVEELQELLLKYREDLIAAKIAKEVAQDSLKREKRILKDRIVAEQQQKDDMEDQLTHEVDSLKEKLFILEGVQEALEREQKQNNELRKLNENLKLSSEENRVKDVQLIQVLKSSVAEINSEKSRLEAELHRMQCKNSSLTQDLNNSEAVQRDFVKLSQSLQVELEKIRSSEKEVRWQDPEDVDECNSCKSGFSRSKKRHNCRHCGKVFCPECTTKNVPSGPHGKPARVCDVCHTLLVSNTAPYFSSDPPRTPD